MCKYTVYNYECGHRAGDHVDSSQCMDFQRTGVHCDRDNPANKDRVKVKTKSRNGVCDTCLRPRRIAAENITLDYDLKTARDISMAEAKAHEEHMQRAEQRAREESLAQATELQKAQDARIAELERWSAEEYASKLQEQEDADFEFMIKQSREEAEHAAHEREMEAMQRAFQESIQLNQPTREYQDKVTRNWSEDLGDGQIAEWTETETTTWTTSKGKGPAIPRSSPPSPYLKRPDASNCQPPPPPPPPPAPTEQHDVPIPPSPPAPIPKDPAFPPTKQPTPKPTEPKALGYSMPAMGPQNIGRFKVGTRSQPIHPSQEIEEPRSSKSPILPSAPAPFARLGGQVGLKVPAMRQAQGPGVYVPSSTDPRSGLRRSAGPRSSFPSPEIPQVDAQLQALLAKRRKWEPEEDSDRSGNVP
ncbi:hypothetical protein T440DRAFT_487109 [Plenodomus tracheiphilus IPT5]|uniref:Uncharacterized protein n=1 Tax=Plenodomus tracheiphilus IPT5 TaxID=1408161 RepID=A0A6A7BH53_9PLEO|nr:hypothetical protein T440DRAFT_487109 [Plenodomus tracheiphilus IPT5]